MRRVGLPPGGSTLMTSAPKPANASPQYSACSSASSMTRRPVSAPGAGRAVAVDRTLVLCFMVTLQSLPGTYNAAVQRRGNVHTGVPRTPPPAMDRVQLRGHCSVFFCNVHPGRMPWTRYSAPCGASLGAQLCTLALILFRR